MTSEVEERPRLVTAGYGRHGSQWVKDDRKGDIDYFMESARVRYLRTSFTTRAVGVSENGRVSVANE